MVDRVELHASCTTLVIPRSLVLAALRGRSPAEGLGLTGTRLVCEIPREYERLSEEARLPVFYGIEPRRIANGYPFVAFPFTYVYSYRMPGRRPD